MLRILRRRSIDLTKHIDWTCFADELKSGLPELATLPLEQRFAAFWDLMISAAEAAQTRPTPSGDTDWTYGGTVPWWDDELGAAHRQAIQAEQSLKRIGGEETFDQLMDVEKTFQRLRHRYKRDSLREYCGTFDEHAPISELFRAAKRFRNRGSTSEPCMSDDTLEQHTFRRPNNKSDR